MSLRIQIDCYHQYRCQCKPIVETKVSKQEIAYNLIRCNPGLARYLGKTNVLTQTVIQRNQYKVKQQPTPYKSIVDQKNLNILLADRYPINKKQQPKHQQRYQPQKPKSPTALQLQINNYISTQVQTTSPQLIKKQQVIKSPREKEIKQYFKQLKQTSRYLSDTGFRKYFNRQVFENYGRENTHGTNDGIIYGNYMKTHNINPHIGDNQPHDEETFYHALATASPQKLLSPKNINQIDVISRSRNNTSQSRYKEGDVQTLQKPLKKHQNNAEQIIGDNARYHEKIIQLQKSKSRSRSKGGLRKVSGNKIVMKNTQYNSTSKMIKAPNSASKSPQNNHIQFKQQQPRVTSPRIQSQYVNTKQTIQPIRYKQPQILINNRPQLLSPRSTNKISNKQEINRMSQIKSVYKKCPVDMIKQNHMEHIFSTDCKVIKPHQSVARQSRLY